jgi:hypothetical protein
MALFLDRSVNAEAGFSTGLKNRFAVYSACPDAHAADRKNEMDAAIANPVPVLRYGVRHNRESVIINHSS